MQQAGTGIPEALDWNDYLLFDHCVEGPIYPRNRDIKIISFGSQEVRTDASVCGSVPSGFTT
jgi:hypothetical protein